MAETNERPVAVRLLQCTQKDVEKGNPVQRRPHVPLSCSNLRFKRGCRRPGFRKCLVPVPTETLFSVRSTDHSSSPFVQAYKIGRYMFRNSKSNPAKNKDRLRHPIECSFDIPARQKKVRPCLFYFFKCVTELKESSFRGFGFQKGMLAGAQYVV